MPKEPFAATRASLNDTHAGNKKFHALNSSPLLDTKGADFQVSGKPRMGEEKAPHTLEQDTWN